MPTERAGRGHRHRRHRSRHSHRGHRARPSAARHGSDEAAAEERAARAGRPHEATASTPAGEAVFWALAAVVALAPLPLASNRPWAWSLLALLVGLLLVAWAAAAWRSRRLVTLASRRSVAFALPFVAVLAWALAQASGATPPAWDHPAWAAAQAALDRPLDGAAALTPAGAVETVMRLVTYAGVFWLALFYGRSRRHAEWMLWLVGLVGAGYAVYGLTTHLGGFDRILWLDKWAYRDSLTSTFVNRNSYATYAGLGLVAVLALLFERLHRAAGSHLPLRSAVVRAMDAMGFAPWLLLAAAVVLGSALVLSNSRGGALATVVAVAVLLLCFAARGGRRRGTWPLLALLAAGLGAVLFAFSGEELLGRVADALGDERSGGGRATVYALTLQAIAERPWLGIGLGGFPGMFYAERTAAFGDMAVTYLRAHNSYLEVALEVGLPAFAVLLAVLAALVVRAVIGLARRHRHQVYPSAAVAATALVATHALIDFSLQMPAVAVTYAFVLGAGTAQSWPSRPPHPAPDRPSPDSAAAS